MKITIYRLIIILTVSIGMWHPLPSDIFVNKLEAMSTEISGVNTNLQ